MVYELHSPRLINIATLPCENENIENVILHREIPKENYMKCVIALSKCTSFTVFLKCIYLECYTTIRV